MKDKRPKDRKKKKKDKDAEKKKKKEKKEKKDKEETKIERDDTPELGEKSELDDTLVPEEEAIVEDEQIATKEESPKTMVPRAEEKVDFTNLYEGTNAPVKLDAIKNDEFILNNEEIDDSEALNPEKESSFDGIELQTGEELDMKLDEEVKERVPKNEMLAPMPELSKWEMDDEQSDKREPGEIVSPPPDKSGKVTSEVLKRAENAIFAKAINAIRPIEIKKISMDRVKLYSADTNADSKPESQIMDSLQITVPSTDLEYRAIEINDSKKMSEKTPPPTKLSVKDRLGSKVEDLTRRRDEGLLLSTVERIKSRSKTPKRTERRIIVDSNVSRRVIGKVDGQSKADKHGKRIKEVESHKSRDLKRKEKEVKKHKHHGEKKHKKVDEVEAKKSTVSKVVEEVKEVGKKSTLDEANFEPDYDENLESEGEVREAKKRERPSTPMHSIENPKRARVNEDEDNTIKLDLTNVKKRAPSETSSSGSDSSSSSSSTESERKRRRRKKKAKKRKHRKHSSDSGSESDTDSDEPKKKKKKRKHKKKTSKKKKKGKHR